MKEKCFGMGVVAMVAAAFATVGMLRVTAADSPAHVAGQDFLAKAMVALNAVQAKVKDDKILGPLTKAKVEEGKGGEGYLTAKGYLTIKTQTSESWLNFPSKDESDDLARGYGWLRVDVYSELPKELPCTPFVPSPGCYYGSTYLVVPDTQAKVLIETTTSDPGAQRRLVNLIVKELGNAGITARPNKPEKVDSFPRPPLISAPRPPIIPLPAGQPVQRSPRRT